MCQPASHAEREQITAAGADGGRLGGRRVQGGVQRGEVGGVGGEAADLTGGEARLASRVRARLTGEKIPEGRTGGGGEAACGPGDRLRPVGVEVDERE